MSFTRSFVILAFSMGTLVSPLCPFMVEMAQAQNLRAEDHALTTQMPTLDQGMPSCCMLVQHERRVEFTQVSGTFMDTQAHSVAATPLISDEKRSLRLHPQPNFRHTKFESRSCMKRE